MMSRYNLSRLHEIQDRDYVTALSEIRREEEGKATGSGTFSLRFRDLD